MDLGLRAAHPAGAPDSRQNQDSRHDGRADTAARRRDPARAGPRHRAGRRLRLRRRLELGLVLGRSNAGPHTPQLIFAPHSPAAGCYPSGCGGAPFPALSGRTPSGRASASAAAPGGVG